MKILVTGGLGFIGCNLVKKLLKNPENKVFNFDSRTYAANLDIAEEFNNYDNYHEHKIDIGIDYTEIRDLIAYARPDVVFHLAAESHVDRSITHADDFIQTNLVGTFNLLKASLKYHKENSVGKFRFIHISTDEVYGSLSLERKDEKFIEDQPYKPNSPYSASKAGSDHLVRAWFETYQLPTIITHCCNNYGPYQNPEKLIPKIIKNAYEGIPIPIYGDGKNVRDWIYVEDHNEALIQAYLYGFPGETYNIGSQFEISNIDLAFLICDMIDKKLGTKDRRDLITFVEDRPGHDRRYAIDPSKLEKATGWMPTLTFEEGLNRTIEFYLGV